MIRESRLGAPIASFDALFDGDGGGCREANGWDTSEGCVPRVERLGSIGFRHRTRAGTRSEDGRTRAGAKNNPTGNECASDYREEIGD